MAIRFCRFGSFVATSTGSVFNFPFVSAATSRAIPAMLRQSPRLGVTAISNSQSSWPFSSACAAAIDSTSRPAIVSVLASSAGGRSTSTNSFSQLKVNFIGLEYWSFGLGKSRPHPPILHLSRFRSAKLVQKSQVVLKKQANIVDAVFQHGDAFDAHAEREAGYLLGIVADELEHRRIDHAGAEDFQPARRLAYPAALTGLARTAAAADHALNVDLRAGLGKREEARTESDGELAAEDLAQEMSQHTFQVGKRDGIVDHEPFDLMEHRRVRRVVVVAIDRAGHDDLQRRPAALHGADLHRRGVRSQQPAVRYKEGILHVARRMVFGKIERL